jgi:hypothetical protein
MRTRCLLFAFVTFVAIGSAFGQSNTNFIISEPCRAIEK